MAILAIELIFALLFGDKAAMKERTSSSEGNKVVYEIVGEPGKVIAMLKKESQELR